MKPSVFLLLIFASCSDTSTQSQSGGQQSGEQVFSQIVVYVHFNADPSVGKKIVLLPPGDTTLTDSSGQARFSVPAGKYTIQAFDIGGPGPARGQKNFDITTTPGETTKVDIFDCRNCV